jgi:hypothetical protein
VNPSHWLGLSPQEASEELFKLIVGHFLKEEGYRISADQNVKILTQRLYGDYRQVHMTNEFKRAERHIKFLKNSPLWKALS